MASSLTGTAPAGRRVRRRARFVRWARLVSGAAAAAVLLGAGDFAAAQSAGAPAKHNNNTYGSPLDTLRATRLWTDVPPARDFVRDSRPDPKHLDFTPLTGSDPERPKPRDAANVEALQAELERDGTANARKMERPRRVAKPMKQRGETAKHRGEATARD